MSIATLKQANKLLELVIQKGTSSQQLQAILENGFLADLLDANLSGMNREEFRRILGLKTPSQQYVLGAGIFRLPGIVLPEQSRTLDDRIADGNYDWKNGNITSQRFQLTLPAGPCELVLAHFNKVMTSKQVQQWATENGYEVALIDDLLAVGSHSEYRELQRQFPIIALGSFNIVCDERIVLCLGGRSDWRCLNLSASDFDWGDDFRFLLRKAS